MKHRSTDAANLLNRWGGVGHGLLDGIGAVAQIKQSVYAGLALRHRFHRKILRRDAKGEVYAAGEEQCGKTGR